MMQELHFALYAIKKNIQSSAELRTSFLMNIIGMAINNIAFIILWVYFIQAVGIIGGWTAADIIGLQGFTAICYGLVFSFAGGIKKLPDYVSSGSFDRFMLSPKNILMRVSTSSFTPSGIGDLVFGVICLLIYGILMHASMVQILLIMLLVALATIIFFSVTVVIYSVSFLFTDAAFVVDGLFTLFLTPSLFHGGAFQGALRAFFMFVIPALLVGTIPVEIVKDISMGKLAIVAVFTVIWLVLSIKIFNRAVRHYESSNLMTFGG
ncbi:MAG: ABC-2 family transporter protein [bacterium]|nr:ABC-2 family transporter protein [bacterium]